MIGAVQIGVSALVTIGVAVLGFVAAGALSMRRGRAVEQDRVTDTYKEAAEAWEARYRAQQEELREQKRRIDALNQKVEAGEKEREQLRAELAELRGRPDYDALVNTVQELATVVKAAVDNEERLRAHAHNLTALGGAINLKLDGILKTIGVEPPTEERTPS